jgi:hypothetical protein
MVSYGYNSEFGLVGQLKNTQIDVTNGDHVLSTFTGLFVIDKAL